MRSKYIHPLVFGGGEENWESGWGEVSKTHPRPVPLPCLLRVQGRGKTIEIERKTIVLLIYYSVIHFVITKVILCIFIHITLMVINIIMKAELCT